MNLSAIPDLLALMDEQRTRTFATLDGLSDAVLWRAPAPGEWSIGEILAHVIRFERSMTALLPVAWWLGRPFAWPWRERPYGTDYDDPYRRPDFPMGVGWVWSPRKAARERPSRQVLEERLVEAHGKLRAFYEDKDPRILGHIKAWDPAIGTMNLIQGLRVVLYHDELHFEDVRRLASTP